MKSFARHNSALRVAAKRVLVLGGFFALVSPVVACPMCKDSAVDIGKPAVAEASGLDFNKSIYIMLGGFLGVVGLTGRVMYKAAKSSGL